jgi:tetratricopeptide (TPR) repeat protein
MSAPRIRITETGADLRALADIVEQVTRRLEAGEALDLEACARQFPEHARELKSLLPALKVFAAGSRSRAQRAPGGAGTSDGTRSRPLEGPPLALRLGDYRILREVGRGGMGIVYEAEQVSLGRRVALKILPFAAILDPRQLQRFQREAHAAALLHHTNIVPVFAVGCERGVHFYAMQFIHGRSLRVVIDGLRSKRQKQPGAISSRAYFRTVARLGLQAAEALQHAHAKGIVHRDIKPSNLLLDRERNLWVTDFGLARVDGDESLTLTGDIVGTLRYMSPEQAIAGHLDPRADVYSLGVTLHELLTLEPAFAAEKRERLLRDLAEAEPAPPSRLNRAVPKDLETIVLRAAARDPRNRYASAQDLAEDLRRFLDGRAVLARRPSLVVRLVKWAGRRKALVACALALFAALVSSGFLLREHRLEAERRDREIYGQKILDGICLLHIGRNSASVSASDSDFVRSGCGNSFKLWTAEVPMSVDPLVTATAMLGEAEALIARRPEAMYLAARALAALGRSDEALAKLDRLIAVHPGSVPAAAFRRALLEPGAALPDPGKAEGEAAARDLAWVAAHVAYARRRWTDAADAASRALRAVQIAGKGYEGMFEELHLTRAEARFQMKDYRGVIEDLGALRVLAPHLGSPKALLATAYHLSGDPARAAEIFEDLYRTGQPRDVVAIRIATRYDELGDHEMALSWARRIEEPSQRFCEESHQLHHLGRAEEALLAARKAVEAAPSLALPHLREAMVLSSLGWLDEAIGAARRAVEAEPTSARERNNLGSYLFRQNRMAEAEIELEKAIQLDSALFEAQYTLATIYSRTGRLQEAVRSLEKCLDGDPEGPRATEVCWFLADLLHKKGALAHAIEGKQAEIRGGERSTRKHLLLSTLLLKAERPVEALNEAKAAVALAPRSADGLTLQGNALWRMGRRTLALEAFKGALEIDGNHPEALLLQGIVHAQSGRFDDAKRLWHRLEEVRPDLPLASEHLGRLARWQNRPADAIRHFLEVGKRRPEPAPWEITLGWCFHALGKHDEAEVVFRRGIAALEKLPPDERLRTVVVPGDIAVAYEALAERADHAGESEEARRRLYAASIDVHRRLAGAERADPQALYSCARALLVCPFEDLRDPGIALSLAEKAYDLAPGTDVSARHILALACFSKGDAARAVKLEEEALALLPPPHSGDDTAQAPPGATARSEVESSLERYRSALKEKQAVKSGQKAPRRKKA